MTPRKSLSLISPKRLSRRLVVTGALVAAAAALLGTVPVAHADDAAAPAPKGVYAEFIVILATQTEGPDDPEVKKWKPATGPLSLFKQRKVLSVVGRTRLEQGAAPYMLRVKDGPTLGITFRDTVRDEKKGIRHSLGAELKTSSGASTVGLTFGPDDRLFIAGPQYQAGTLFFGIHVYKE